MALKQNDTLVIIPVFNEEKNIRQVIEELFNNFKDVDILVVNDGSIDGTLEKIKDKNIFIINHIFNMGTGASFETGCRFALEQGYNYIVRMDGDGQHDSTFIKNILAPIKNNKADITIGSRFLGDSKFTSSQIRLMGIYIISFILTLITKKIVSDPTSGFCAMNRRAFEFFAKNCAEDYPEPEILFSHREFRIKEVSISINKRFEGVSSITPLKSIYYMIKVLLSLFVHIFRKNSMN